MKRIFTIGLFALTLLFGTTTAQAQEKYKVMDEVIKAEAQDLQKILDLDNEQTALVARTIFARAKSLDDVETNSKMNEKEKTEMKAKIEMNFKSRMTDILDENQFAQYSAYQAKKKSKEK
ncbi:MAG: hypothetical protein HKN00_04790 [Flavobacteriaceae bacterium]|nr:hypothetical protein [Bacteroidia bacterium]MBT8288633.1 hypothetical protein [Bacteroidia bacterium]NNF74479.1 hypothetical protein [Flavobacteriaceae bacterium]NNK72530.1 hypothetical protein [Flavobacteriaceae bacterium]